MPRCPVCRRRLGQAARCPEDGAAAEAAPARVEPAAPRLPGWNPAAFLGGGGFADVWADAAGRAAIKVGRTATAAARARLAREAEILEALGAPAAPALLDRGLLDSGAPYLIMERIEGAPLAALLAEAEAPATGRVAALGEALFAAADRVHRGGWVHADLKPENIRVAGDAVRLLDFGLAVRRGEAAGAGTPEYASPEQLRGEPLSPASDVFALGLILYELVAGAPPFAGVAAAYAHQALRPRPLRERVDVPPAAAALIDACLEKRPAARPAAADAAETWAEAMRGAAPLRRRRLAARPRREPPALVAFVRVESPPEPRRWLEELAAAGGVPVRVESDRAVAGFVAEPGRRPVEAALAWLAGRGGVVHLAPAHLVRRKGAVPLLESPATHRRAPWAEAAPPPGEMWATEAARAALGHRATEPAAPGYHRLVPEREAPPLLGRDEELEAAAEALAPGRLLLFCAAAGLGKSRLAAALAERAGLAVTSAADIDELADWPRGLLVVDELERATDETLARIEAAISGGRLGAVGFARPALEARRPRWGWACEGFERRELEPLGPAAAADLAAALLADVGYPPRQALERLADIAGGSPGALVELVAALRGAGAVRADAGGRGRIDLSALDEAAELPLAQWIAETERRRWPPDRAALLEALALGPEELERGEVEALATALSLEADVASGLEALTRGGALRWRGEHVAVASPLLRRGLAAAAGAERRAAAGRAGLAYWSERPLAGDAAASVAHWAAAAGDRERAAAAALAAGDIAARSHRHLEAERAFGRAVELAESFAARLGRGAARYRIDRAADGLADLERAEALADGDAERLAALFEQATALDWLGRYRDSAERTERAAPLCQTPRDAARLSAARGRSALRAGRAAEAASALTEGAEAAAAAADPGTRVIALLLLAPALVQTGELEAAERRFAEVIELCRGAGDRLHLGAAYGNRVILHSARGDIDAALADLERARDIARELGHAVPERNTSYNLALYLYRAGGRDAEAMALARRARWLQARFVGPPLEDALLCARIALALGEKPRAARALADAAAVAARRWTPALRALAAMVELAARPGEAAADAAAWSQVSELADRALAGNDRAEVSYWRARCLGAGADELRAAAAASPVWRRRIAAWLETRE